MKPTSETVLSIPRMLHPVYLLCLCLLLPGCGLWGYFSSDQEPTPVSRSDSTFHSTTATRDGIDDSSGLAELEMFLLQQSPALDPFKESHHPGYTPLDKVDDEMVLTVGRDDAKRSNVQFANLVEEDKSATSLAESES